MGHNAMLGSQQFSDIQVVDRTHPAIIRGKGFRQDGRTLTRGTLVARDMNGELAAYEPGLAGATGWVATTLYSAGALKLPTVTNNHYYRCVTGGTSGAAEPSWPTEPEATVADGTVVWEEAGVIGVDDLVGGGVLTEEIDTEAEVVGSVMVHGTVVAANLLAVGSPASSADIDTLEAIGIYAI